MNASAPLTGSPIQPMIERAPAGLAERFLAEFHDARPGLTTEAFAGLPVERPDGTLLPSSYEALVADARAALDGRPGACLLDLACGDGYLLQRLGQTLAPGTVLQGVDLSAGELRAAQRRLGSRAMLWRARAQALPLAAASVDFVACHMALMLMDDLDGVLAELRRVLKPGASLAVVVGATTPPGAATGAFVQALRTRSPQARWQTLRLGDRRLRTADGLRQALQGPFRQVQVTLLQARRRLSPEALWDEYLRMYDLALLHPGDVAPVRGEFLARARDAADPDGLMLHATHLHHCTAFR